MSWARPSPVPPSFLQVTMTLSVPKSVSLDVQLNVRLSGTDKFLAECKLQFTFIETSDKEKKVWKCKGVTVCCKCPLTMLNDGQLVSHFLLLTQPGKS